MKNIKEKIEAGFQGASDFVMQEIKINNISKLYVCFIDNMIDKALVSKEIVAKLIEKELSNEASIETIKKSISIAGIKSFLTVNSRF